jgi:DNA polymerase III delta prime subunit
MVKELTDEQKIELLAEKMHTLDSLEVKLTFKGMFYGESGCGKTVTAIRLARRLVGRDSKVLYIDSGEGWVSLENFPKLKQGVVRLPSSGVNTLEIIAKAIRAKSTSFGTIGAIILDEGSTIADVDLDRVVKTRAQSDPTKDPDTPTQPDFNTSGNRVRKAFSALYNLDGVHVIVVAHIRKDKDNRGVEVTSPRFLPSLGPKLREPLHLVAYFTADILANAEPVDYARKAQVHPSRTVVAKTRIGGFPAEVSIDDLIKGVVEWANTKRETLSEEQTEVQDNEELFTGITVDGE